MFVIMLLIQPLYSQTEITLAEQAKADVVQDVNKPFWLGAGLILGSFGVLYAATVMPDPPPERDIGTLKSKDIEEYYESYRHEAKKIQTTQAIKGALVNISIITVIYFKGLEDRPEYKF